MKGGTSYAKGSYFFDLGALSSKVLLMRSRAEPYDDVQSSA